MQARPRDNSQRSTLNSQRCKVKPIRVAFLGKSASRGGSQRELSCIVKYLDKSRFEPMVLLPEGGDLLDDFKRGAATHVYSEQTYSESNETREDGILNRLARHLRKKVHGSSRQQAPSDQAQQRDWALKINNGLPARPHFQAISFSDTPF